ncbi:hypothetical protein ACSQ67_002731 [Phaseolus vulgaris]
MAVLILHCTCTASYGSEKDGVLYFGYFSSETESSLFPLLLSGQSRTLLFKVLTRLIMIVCIFFLVVQNF